LLLREIEAGKLARNLFLALTISNGLGVIITLYAGLTDIFVGFGWSDPVFFTLLSVLSFMQMKKQ